MMPLLAMDVADTQDEEEELAPEEEAIRRGQSNVKKAVLAAALLALLAKVTTRAQLLVTEHPPAVFGDRMEDVLLAGHTWASVIGRLRAGVTGPPGDADRELADAAVAAQAEYLAGFVADLERGRYAEEGGETKAGAAARAALYAGGVYATANRAFAAAMPEETLWEWQVNSAQPCEDCPQIAAGGPYTVEQLDEIGYPGAADTICGSNCRCEVIPSGGSGFERE